jgi:hypothetical protein
MKEMDSEAPFVASGSFYYFVYDFVDAELLDAH